MQNDQVKNTLRGTVTFGSSTTPAHNAIVTVAQLKRTAQTDENGVYEFTGIPFGRYDVIAHLDRVPDVVKTVEVSSGLTTVDFKLELDSIREQVTVTATGTAESIENSYQSVNSVSELELAEKIRFPSAKQSAISWALPTAALVRVRVEVV